MPFEILGVEIDIVSFLSDYPWVLLILPILAFIGISYGWKKLIEMYQVQGKPLRPISVILKEAKSLMFDEDIYCVITRKGENVEALLWFTWMFFWRWATALTALMATLSLLKLFGVLSVLNASVLGWAWLALLFIVAYGVVHLRKVFAHRFSTLEKMFSVASSEMRYDGGTNAKIYIYQYVIVASWKQVYYPEETQIMYSVSKFKATEAGRQAAFQAAFDSAVTDKNSWIYEWDTANSRVICSPIPFLPKNITYSFPDRHPWNEFPLGKTFGDEEVVWDVATYPHMLIAGTTGSGKSVTQRTILLHALQSPDWRVLLIDPKRVELSQYNGHPNVLKIATEIDESYALIQQLEQEMMARYARMKEAQVNHFKSLSTIPPAILLMVDEVYSLLELNAGASRTDPVIKEQNEMKAAMTLLVGKIARLGRASGIHMILATQRPDAKVLPGEVKNNLDARIAQGRMDKTPSDMTLNSPAATKLPPIKGRAIYRDGNDLVEFQAYFLAPENLPEFLELSTMIVRGEGDFLFEETPTPEEQEALTAKESKFKMPSIKFNFGATINSWIDKKQSALESNEARAGRAMEPKPKISRNNLDKVTPKEEYVPAAQRDAKDMEEAFEEVTREDLAGGFNEAEFVHLKSPTDIKNDESLFIPAPPEAEKYDFEYSEEEENADGYSDYPEYEDDLDFADDEAEVLSFEEEERSAKAANRTEIKAEIGSLPNSNSRINRTNTFEDLDDSLGADLESSVGSASSSLDAPGKSAQLQPVVEEEEEEYEEEYEEVVLTVADVLRLAAERGVPIPASELLAALKAEAAQQNNAKRAAAGAKAAPVQSNNAQQTQVKRPSFGSPESPTKPSPKESAVVATETAAPTVRQPIKPNTTPPSGKIPSPPRTNRAMDDILASADFGESLDNSDSAPSILPPWMSGGLPEDFESSAFTPPVVNKLDKSAPEKIAPVEKQASRIEGVNRAAEDFLRPAEEEPDSKGPKRPKLF